jgi:peptidoglycan/xylan/chitin deacetylase (PgdA/CDA1 family)
MFQVVSWRRLRPWVLGLAALAMVSLALARELNPAHASSSQGPVYRVATTTKAMALTVNVVWGTEYVPTILRDFEAAHQRGTFYLGGAWAQAHPDLVARIRAAGMEIGNHGYAHRHQSQLSFDANVEEITRASRAIEQAGGGRPVLFAPPYGEYNAVVLRAANALHMPLIMWTIDTIDWRPSSSPSVITARVMRRAAPGAIVLMHPTERTVEALPQILRDLMSQGYRLVTVSDLLRLGTPQGE